MPSCCLVFYCCAECQVEVPCRLLMGTTLRTTIHIRTKALCRLQMQTALQTAHANTCKLPCRMQKGGGGLPGTGYTVELNCPKKILRQSLTQCHHKVAWAEKCVYVLWLGGIDVGQHWSSPFFAAVHFASPQQQTSIYLGKVGG